MTRAALLTFPGLGLSPSHTSFKIPYLIKDPVIPQAMCFSAVSLVWNALLSFLANRHLLAQPPTDAELKATVYSGMLVRTKSGRYLPTHQPPMGILDNDPTLPKSSPTDQTVLGFLLGPGLM